MPRFSAWLAGSDQLAEQLEQLLTDAEQSDRDRGVGDLGEPSQLGGGSAEHDTPPGED